GGVPGPQFTEFGQAGDQIGNTVVGRGNRNQGCVGATGAGQQTVDAGGTARFSGLGGSGGDGGGGSAATSQTRGSQMRVSQRLSFPVPKVAAPVIASRVSSYLTKVSQIGGGVTVVADDAGQVVLQGTVPDDHARKLAEALARLEPGVRQITNELQVQSSDPEPAAAPQLGR
ncbi:MAG: BON domain-containing protein, partial [Planctomycetaceae bacterium]